MNKLPFEIGKLYKIDDYSNYFISSSNCYGYKIINIYLPIQKTNEYSLCINNVFFDEGVMPICYKENTNTIICEVRAEISENIGYINKTENITNIPEFITLTGEPYLRFEVSVLNFAEDFDIIV